MSEDQREAGRREPRPGPTQQTRPSQEEFITFNREIRTFWISWTKGVDPDTDTDTTNPDPHPCLKLL